MLILLVYLVHKHNGSCLLQYMPRISQGNQWHWNIHGCYVSIHGVCRFISLKVGKALIILTGYHRSMMIVSTWKHDITDLWWFHSRLFKLYKYTLHDSYGATLHVILTRGYPLQDFGVGLAESPTLSLWRCRARPGAGRTHCGSSSENRRPAGRVMCRPWFMLAPWCYPPGRGMLRTGNVTPSNVLSFGHVFTTVVILSRSGALPLRSLAWHPRIKAG